MAKQTPEGKALTDLILEIFRFNGEMLEAGNRITEPYGLTSARWQVLGAIDIAGAPLTVAQIARRMGLTRQAVQRIANDLRDLEILAFEPNIDHKRSPLLSITKKGAKVLQEIEKDQAVWVNQLAQGVSERQLKSALKILQVVLARSEDITNSE